MIIYKAVNSVTFLAQHALEAKNPTAIAARETETHSNSSVSCAETFQVSMMTLASNSARATALRSVGTALTLDSLSVRMGMW